MLLIGSALGQAGVCPNGEDYRPCTCHHYSYGDEVYCNNVPLAEVANVFKRTTPAELYRFDLYLPRTEEASHTLPAHLLNNHRVTFRIELHCPTSHDHKLFLHPDAFLLSRESAQLLWIYDCDTTGLDFEFLYGFDALRYIYLYYSSNVHLAQWATLPELLQLTRLYVINSTGLNEWTQFPTLARGLTDFILDNDNINDVAMDRILSWAAESSANSLKYLSIPQNDLTRIPSQAISRFTLLEQLFLGNQRRGIPVIPAGALSFQSRISQLGINSDGVSTIEPGAFQGNIFERQIVQNDLHSKYFTGDFRQTDVRLYYNALTRFESAVFKGVLEQMAASTGSLRVEYSMPIYRT